MIAEELYLRAKTKKMRKKQESSPVERRGRKPAFADVVLSDANSNSVSKSGSIELLYHNGVLILLPQGCTAMRIAMQHYESDAGVEMAAVYLSIVSTVKLVGQLAWRFLGDFLEDMETGGKKHLSLLSLSITKKNLTNTENG